MSQWGVGERERGGMLACDPVKMQYFNRNDQGHKCVFMLAMRYLLSVPANHLCV